MSRWFNKLMQDPNDYTPVGDAFLWFEKQYAEAQKELDMRGIRIEEVSKRLPGMVEYRYGQLVEIKAIISHLDTMKTKAMGEARRRYLEHYQRDLTPTVAEKYAEADDTVIAIRMLRNQMTLIEDRFEGLTKAYEHLLYQLNNITRLRCANMEDIIF